MCAFLIDVDWCLALYLVLCVLYFILFYFLPFPFSALFLRSLLLCQGPMPMIHRILWGPHGDVSFRVPAGNKGAPHRAYRRNN